MDETVTATLEEKEIIRAGLREADNFYEEDEFTLTALKVTIEEQDIITAVLVEQ